MASALINVPAKAKRGEIIEIKTLMSHIMETGYRRTATGEVDPARHHHQLHLPLQRRRDFPRRSVSGDRGQPVHHASSRSRPKAANSISNGSATSGFAETASASITVE